MTDTTTEDAVTDDVATDVEPAADATPDLAAEAKQAAKARNREALETRLLIPLLLPILAMIAVALWALNVSRVFLAGDSTSALVIASILTLAILCGGALISATPKARTSSLAMVDDARARDRRVGRPARARARASTPAREAGPRSSRSPRATPSAPSTSRRWRSIRFNTEQLRRARGDRRVRHQRAPSGTLVPVPHARLQGLPDRHRRAPFPKSGKVELKPGVYNVYCTVDGHAAQGMVATVTVADAPPPST